MLPIPTSDQMLIMEKAINTYSEDAQIDAAMASMAALTKELLKMRRLPETASQSQIEYCTYKIMEEIAGVFIMLNHMQIIFHKYEGDIDNVNLFFEHKLRRLNRRLQELEEI